MDQASLPTSLREAVTVTTAGATGVARLVIEGLLELIDDPAAAADATEFLTAELPGYAPMWHIANAVRSDEPAESLRRIRAELDHAVEKTVKAAVGWVGEHGGPVTCAPSSSIVKQILAQLPESMRTGEPVVALAGADAIGPGTVLNIRGTRELAERLPTLIVTTALKLVPEPVFARLGAPVFEHIPLDSFVGVVLDGEILSPGEVRRRAAELRE
ncbi:hypothetical protein ACN28C_16115 [Plantactinospora sp. WMMC1484]|uniref:hypothetical protein n=1 Tax=Plantactinospora sp. WMMC1484 TaxID=3404122 RepID=UPI003BF53519